MKILLIKPETVGIFAMTGQVEHEPLELEYLYTVISELGYEAVIYDRRHNYTSLYSELKSVNPDVVCITGYITQEPLVKKLIRRIKKYNPSIKIIAGGSHIEINYENFYDSQADYLYHVNGMKYFALLMRYLNGDEGIRLKDIKGICYKQDENWIYNPKELESPQDLPIPDRSFFYNNQKRYGYLKFKPLALIKNSYSCPYSCNFCYCTNRNGGVYRCRNVEQLIEEIRTLDVPNIHITDDNFLTNKEYLREFIDLIKKYDIHKKFLIYGRADFIAENEELIKELAQIGLALVMVGLEAANNDELDSYNKKTSVYQNEECIRILSENNIFCAGLFIVHQDMNTQDFKRLRKWITKRPVIPTISIFTPMQGSANYDEYKDKLITKDIRKQDLFHCILKPKHMSVCRFTLEYYKLSLMLAIKSSKTELYKSLGIKDFFYIFKVFFIKIKRIFAL